MTTYTYDQIENWVKQYAPRVIFHPDEKYFPINVDDYLNQTCIQEQEGSGLKCNKCKQWSKKGDPVCPSNTTKNYSAYSCCAYLNIPSGNFNETIMGDINTAICYVHVVGVGDDIELQYLFFEAFNGGGNAYFNAKWWGGNSSLVGVGDTGSHQGDWEHISVRINSDGEFIGAYYAHHSYGEWLSPSGLRFVSDNNGVKEHPIVYTAKLTHGSYNSKGIFTTLKKKDDTLYDPSFTDVPGISIGGADVTDQGKEWNTWENFKILEIDKLEVTDDPTKPPSWLSYIGLWGGPFTLDYSISEIGIILFKCIVAFAVANPFLFGFILLLIPSAGAIISWLSAGGVSEIAAALGITVTALTVGAFKLYDYLIGEGFTLGPSSLTKKDYWNNGEPATFVTSPTEMKNGSDQIEIKFSSALALTTYVPTSGKGDNSAFVLYSDRSNNFWYEQSGHNGLGWDGRQYVSGTKIHSSPAALYYQWDDDKFLYAFFQDSDQKIRYSVTSDGSSWTNYPLDYEMKKNEGMSVTLWGRKIYMVYRDSGGYMKVVSAAITSNGSTELEDWQHITVNPSINPIDTQPFIATYNESLYVSYMKGGVSYLWQCYTAVDLEGDNGPEAKLQWGGPSTYDSGKIPTDFTPQPSVVGDQLRLIFINTSVESNAATNLFGVTVDTDNLDQPNVYPVSESFSLGLNIRAENSPGLASVNNTPLALAIRKEDTDYLYTAASYIG